MSRKSIITYIVIICAIAGVAVYTRFFRAPNPATASITSFDECVAAGYPVLESYPRQCRPPDGRNFVEDILVYGEHPGEIKVNGPAINEVVTSPLLVSGEAKGSWYFEATFPIEVRDGNGRVIGQSFVTAQSDWMKDALVPFTGMIAFTPPTTTSGSLVLRKDNPSGLPENALEIRIPIKFSVAP